VDIGPKVYRAQAHVGVGGPGTAACSGDLLLGALAACAQITCQMVAAALGISANSIVVDVEGDLDLRGTLGVSKEDSRIRKYSCRLWPIDWQHKGDILAKV